MVGWVQWETKTPAPVTVSGRAWLIVMVGAVDRQDPAEEPRGLAAYSNCYDTGGLGILPSCRCAPAGFRVSAHAFTVFSYGRKWDKFFLSPRASSPPKEPAENHHTGQESRRTPKAASPPTPSVSAE
jgi:hypothetical protein